MIEEEIRSKKGIITLNYLRQIIKERHGIDVNKRYLLNAMRQDHRLEWKRVKPNESYVNTPKNVGLRQIFACKLIEAIKSETVLLNFDESAISFSNYRRYSWDRIG